MNRVMFSVLAGVMMAALLPGQSSPPTIYAESFRQGPTRIIGETFELKLTPANATYQKLIRDAQGKDRYVLTVMPQMPGGDDKITSWAVTLRDLRHSIYGDILLAEQEPSEEAKNNLGRLDPSRFGAVPTHARRIMKVEGFYVMIQVGALRFTPLDSPYLESMAVQFAFSNSDPRASN